MEREVGDDGQRVNEVNNLTPFYCKRDGWAGCVFWPAVCVGLGDFVIWIIRIWIKRV